MGLQASAHWGCQWRELKKPLLDASRRAQMVVPELFLEWMTDGLEAQYAAQLAKQQAQPVERQPELTRPAKQAVALAQTEPLEAAPRQVRLVFLLEPLANLEQHAQLVPGQVQRASRVVRQDERAWILRLSWPPLPPLRLPQARESAFGPARHARDQASSNGSFSPSRQSGGENRSAPWL